jgi:hypothetical protein
MFDQCSVDCKLVTVCVHFNLGTCTERIPKQIKSLNRISTIYLHLGFFSNLGPLQNTVFSKGTSWYSESIGHKWVWVTSLFLKQEIDKVFFLITVFWSGSSICHCWELKREKNCTSIFINYISHIICFCFNYY